MLAIPDCNQDLAVAHIPYIGPPCPAVVLAPAGLVHPESAGGRAAEEEPVLQRIAVRIGCQSSPPDPSSRILRCRPVRAQDIEPGPAIGAAQGKGYSLLDIKSVRSGVLAVSDPHLNLIAPRGEYARAPGPDTGRRPVGLRLHHASCGWALHIEPV